MSSPVPYTASLRWVALCACLTASLIVSSAFAQDYSLPVRWCVIGDDANGNGVADPGELGAPAFTDPSLVGEPNTDTVLWRRHERPSDRTYIPQAGVTFRSALWNIAEDATLNFPIIPDPDTSDPDHEYGDLLSSPRAERDLARDACIEAWRDDHGVDDIGIIAIVARRLVNGAGEPVANGVGRSGGRLLWVHDNAFAFPDPTPEGDLRDPFDGTFGHEAGHALPAALNHANSDVNIMRSSPADVANDGVRDNFDLSNSITDDEGDVVNQIALVSDTAPSVPGCKLTGTDTDCSTRSDAHVDQGRDVEEAFLDLRLVTLADQDDATTLVVHEVAGPFTAKLADFGSVEFFTFIDTDGDANTGGRPETLAVPTAFAGAEIVARVTVRPVTVQVVPPDGQTPDVALVAEATLWRFDPAIEGFAELDKSKDVRARVNPIVDIIDPIAPGGKSIRELVGHTVEVIFPNTLRGPMVERPRLQAMARGEAGTVGEIVDRLDNTPEERGVVFRLVFPSFPVCEVTPDPVSAGAILRVKAAGFLGDVPVKVILGDTMIGEGQTTAAGELNAQFPVPSDAREGKRLITVGIKGKALTADCLANVRKTGPDGGGDPEKCCGPILDQLIYVIYALILVILVLILALIWVLLRRRK